VQFSLQLSEKEQIDRAKVVLPFEHQGMEPVMRVGVAYMCMSCVCMYNVYKVCAKLIFLCVYLYVYTNTCVCTHTDMHVCICVCVCILFIK
jgi:hypothetical protein